MSGNKAGTALLVDLAKGFALSEFYPHKHPSLVQGILKLDVALQARPEDAKVEVNPTGMSLAGEGLAHRSPHVERFAARLNEHEIRSLVFRRDMGSESVGRFLSACTLLPRVARAAGGFHAVLAAAGAGKVAVNGSWVEPALPAASSPAPPRRCASKPSAPSARSAATRPTPSSSASSATATAKSATPRSKR